jgi:pSer/pThr/pTyr-binding forkhead associated (FHA) protein
MSDVDRFPSTPDDFCIRVVGGTDAGQVYQLAARTVVGRDRKLVDVFIDSLLMARRHFVLVWDEDACRHFVDDAWHRPQAPVFVNDRPIGKEERVPLKTGDRLRVGDTTLVYEHLPER